MSGEQIPEYTVEWQAQFELWCVLESGFVLAYCPEKGSALFIASACRQQRRAVTALAEAHQAASKLAGVIGLN